jgi:hypothetical protein
MNRLRNFGFQFGKKCAFVAFSALTCFASCAAQNEHSGYQGIPVRNGLNRGAISRVEVNDAHAYSGLPQRLNYSDSGAIAISAENNQCTENAQPSGYRGIPQTTISQNAATPDDVPDLLPVDSAGYRGIPQSIDVSRNNFARTASAFVRQK